MWNEALDWMRRMKAVEREHGAIRVAIDRLQHSTEQSPTLLDENLKPLDSSHAARNLEFTYILRLFIEFESGLKRFLRSRHVRIPGSAKSLIDRVAVRARTSIKCGIIATSLFILWIKSPKL